MERIGFRVSSAHEFTHGPAGLLQADSARELAKDLTLRLGPIEPVLARLDPLLLNPPQLRKN